MKTVLSWNSKSVKVTFISDKGAITAYEFDRAGRDIGGAIYELFLSPANWVVEKESYVSTDELAIGTVFHHSTKLPAIVPASRPEAESDMEYLAQFKIL